MCELSKGGYEMTSPQEGIPNAQEGCDERNDGDDVYEEQASMAQ
jgi:hypothetical protein